MNDHPKAHQQPEIHHQRQPRQRRTLTLLVISVLLLLGSFLPAAFGPDAAAQRGSDRTEQPRPTEGEIGEIEGQVDSAVDRETGPSEDNLRRRPPGPVIGPADEGTIVINEVEADGPGNDWIEFHNPSIVPVNISGYRVIDGNFGNTAYVFPPNSWLQGRGFIVIERNVDFTFGLAKKGDSVYLSYPHNGGFADSIHWNAEVPTTLGRCTDGVGNFAITAASTYEDHNDCAGAGWPGAPTTTLASSLFGGELSGLDHFRANSSSSNVLWAVQNDGPARLHRLDSSNGTQWTNTWGQGKPLLRANQTGVPDAEGVTHANNDDSKIFVAMEGDNSIVGTPPAENVILRYDTTATSAALVADREWDLTASVPAMIHNRGFEAITWVPDAHLVANGFVDQRTGQAYNPSHPDFVGHGTGLFFVGAETSGLIFAVALNDNGTHHVVATITSGLANVAALEFDKHLKELYAVCDDTCNGELRVMRIDAAGSFVPTLRFFPPTLMQGRAGEGFAIADIHGCSLTKNRRVYWAEDTVVGPALHQGFFTCAPL